jgi:TRAP-type mannitol/chloroaromatic compound transport system substrate-binding protein
MAKKLTILMGVLVLLLMLLPTGCGEKESTGETPTATPAKVFEWRFQTTESPGMVSYDKVFAELVSSVETMSNGRLKLTLYANNALVPQNEIFNAVKAGTIEMGFGTGAFWMGTVPMGAITYGLPFGPTTVEEWENWMFNEGILDIAREAYAEHNVYLVQPVMALPYGSIMSRVPITSLEDLKGKKIRSIGTTAAIWQAFGASTTMTNIAEIYTSVATGVVDGANIGNPSRFAAIKLQEVAKYYTMPPVQQFACGEFIVNMNKWNELPDDLKAILEAACHRASVRFRTEFLYLDYATLNKWQTEDGVTINTFSDADVARMREVAIGIWDTLAKDKYTTQAIEITKNYMKMLGYIK